MKGTFVSVATKSNIIDEIVEQLGNSGCRIKKADVQRVIEEFREAVVGRLCLGQRIEMRGFLIIEPKFHKQRLAFNPKTGARVMVPGRWNIRVRMGGPVLDRIRRKLLSAHHSDDKLAGAPPTD